MSIKTKYLDQFQYSFSIFRSTDKLSLCLHNLMIGIQFVKIMLSLYTIIFSGYICLHVCTQMPKDSVQIQFSLFDTALYGIAFWRCYVISCSILYSWIVMFWRIMFLWWKNNPFIYFFLFISTAFTWLLGLCIWEAVLTCMSLVNWDFNVLKIQINAEVV